MCVSVVFVDSISIITWNFFFVRHFYRLNHVPLTFSLSTAHTQICNVYNEFVITLLSLLLWYEWLGSSSHSSRNGACVWWNFYSVANGMNIFFPFDLYFFPAFLLFSIFFFIPSSIHPIVAVIVIICVN